MSERRSEGARKTPGDDSDEAGPLTGRQPERPGQHARFQPRPGDRDPHTLDSREPEGFGGPPASEGALPTSQQPRRGTANAPPLPSSPAADDDEVRGNSGPEG